MSADTNRRSSRNEDRREARRDGRYEVRQDDDPVNKRPSHIVFHVRSGENAKAYFDRIGSAQATVATVGHQLETSINRGFSGRRPPSRDR